MTEKPRKVVSRNVAIVLGLVSILVASSLAIAVLYYQPLVADKDKNISDLTAQNQAQSAQNNYLDSQVSTLQNQTASDDAQINSLNSQINALRAWLNGNVSLLNSLNASANEANSTFSTQLTALASVGFGLNVTTGVFTINSNASTLQSTVWLSNQTVNNTADSYTSLGNFTANNAGYIVLNATSTKPRTYARIIYSANGINFDSGEVTVGQNGTAIFAVLPANVQVIVGNHAANAGAAGVTETVTILYFH
jgi:cell division protein FtsL